jgi:hypothetical protein
MFERVGGRVKIDLSEQDYHQLIFVLGNAAGMLVKQGSDAYEIKALADAINEGNPNWRRYTEAPYPPAPKYEPR